MFEQLEKLEDRYRELEGLLASHEVISNQELCNKYAKELSALKDAVSLFREYKRFSKEAKDLEAVLGEKHDKEFLELAKKELGDLEGKRAALEERLKQLLAGEDKDIGRDVILEIRQGTGGMEAGLFAADLYRMYTQYAANKAWSVENMSANPTELGGFKERVFSV
ncbi:MAG: PCRF domain-containing protein, partial [Candidatus Omnitrophota bacterium]